MLKDRRLAARDLYALLGLAIQGQLERSEPPRPDLYLELSDHLALWMRVQLAELAAEGAGDSPLGASWEWLGEVLREPGAGELGRIEVMPNALEQLAALACLGSAGPDPAPALRSLSGRLDSDQVQRMAAALVQVRDFAQLDSAAWQQLFADLLQEAEREPELELL